MGGTLAAEDTPGGGLTMAITLPPVEDLGAVRGPVSCVAARTVSGSWSSTTNRRSCERCGTCAPRVQVHTAANGRPHPLAGQHPPDLVVLDLGLPDFDGVQVIDGLRGWTRRRSSWSPDAPSRQGRALDAGADDYVTKPFRIDELFARLRAVSRRVTGQHRRAPGWASGWSTSRPTCGPPGRRQKLTPTEWRILEILARNPGRWSPSSTS